MDSSWVKSEARKRHRPGFRPDHNRPTIVAQWDVSDNTTKAAHEDDREPKEDTYLAEMDQHQQTISRTGTTSSLLAMFSTKATHLSSSVSHLAISCHHNHHLCCTTLWPSCHNACGNHTPVHTATTMLICQS